MNDQNPSRPVQWGIKINSSSSFKPGDFPDWLNPSQKKDWRRKGVVVWERQTHTVANIFAGVILQFEAWMKENETWQQEGITVGTPATRISIDHPEEKPRQVLTNEIKLDPNQAVEFFDFIYKNEALLKKMAKEEEDAELDILASVYKFILNDFGKGQLIKCSDLWAVTSTMASPQTSFLASFLCKKLRLGTGIFSTSTASVKILDNGFSRSPPDKFLPGLASRKNRQSNT